MLRKLYQKGDGSGSLTEGGCSFSFTVCEIVLSIEDGQHLVTYFILVRTSGHKPIPLHVQQVFKIQISCHPISFLTFGLGGWFGVAFFSVIVYIYMYINTCLYIRIPFMYLFILHLRHPMASGFRLSTVCRPVLHRPRWALEDQ